MVRGSRFVRDFEIYLLNAAVITKFQAFGRAVFPRKVFVKLIAE